MRVRVAVGVGVPIAVAVDADALAFVPFLFFPEKSYTIRTSTDVKIASSPYGLTLFSVDDDCTPYL